MGQGIGCKIYQNCGVYALRSGRGKEESPENGTEENNHFRGRAGRKAGG